MPATIVQNLGITYGRLRQRSRTNRNGISRLADISPHTRAVGLIYQQDRQVKIDRFDSQQAIRV